MYNNILTNFIKKYSDLHQNETIFSNEFMINVSNHNICIYNSMGEKLWERIINYDNIYINSIFISEYKIYYDNTIMQISNSRKQHEFNIRNKIIIPNINDRVKYSNFVNSIYYYYSKIGSYLRKYLFWYRIKNFSCKFDYIHKSNMKYRRKRTKFFKYRDLIKFIPNKYELNYYSNTFNLIT